MPELLLCHAMQCAYCQQADTAGRLWTGWILEGLHLHAFIHFCTDSHVLLVA